MVINGVRVINSSPFRPWEINPTTSCRQHSSCKTLEVLMGLGYCVSYFVKVSLKTPSFPSRPFAVCFRYFYVYIKRWKKYQFSPCHYLNQFKLGSRINGVYFSPNYASVKPLKVTVKLIPFDFLYTRDFFMKTKCFNFQVNVSVVNMEVMNFFWHFR